jgi:hypothetical protein
VYSFIIKFTQLRGKVDGLNSPMECVEFPVHFPCIFLSPVPSFEEALLSHEPHTIMTQILTRFVLNLKPGTRNVR